MHDLPIRLMRHESAVEHDPAVDAWLEARLPGLARLARPGFDLMRGLGDGVRTLVLALAACTLPACGPSLDEPPPTHSSYGERLSDAGLHHTVLGRAWFSAAQTSLESPDRPELPLALRGVWLAHEASALGIVFTGVAGQVLRISLERTPLAGSTADSRVYVDLYRVDRSESEIDYDPVEIETTDGSQMRSRLPRDGEFVLRVQPELLASMEYRLALELTAALPFPVAGMHTGAAQSLFGDPRDGGRRRHEGVDIFAPRATPVVAVDSGRAVARSNRLGGNVVWLRSKGRSYYYAHLERAAVDVPRRVEAGEVVGYVGNSGNAQSTPTHLHFGLYRRGTGAIDPLPYLRANQFESAPSFAPFSPRFVLTTASRLNLRVGPSRRARVIDVLPKGTVAWVDASSGQWSRVQVAGRPRGWLHVDYQRPLDVPIGERLAAGPALLMRPADGRPTPIGVVPAGAVVETLADFSGSELVRLRDGSAGSASGWYQPLHEARRVAETPTP